MNAGACSENWNAMRPVMDGRFCSKCQHAVIDFSGWDRAAVVAYKQQHPEACGVYLPEHLEPELIPLVDLLSAKRGLLAAGLALGAITVHAQSAPTVPTEQTDPARPTSPRPTIAPEHMPTEAIPGIKSKDFAGICPLDQAPKAPKRHRYHKLYVSKRFPFIHFRRRYMGKMSYTVHDNMLRVTGTPSF
ncbi:MAG: hypothetical protein IPN85_05725 [Flavobacteriales bacterium]|jgi:hypothetical protein|nr:hypothetical protein [Flavobacteriales bacterium]MBK9287773.1 hypothetical protein [Flavobacteriales bacterium]MBL0035496.1 hypothetical protein [Flavobacteriales bacterium]